MNCRLKLRPAQKAATAAVAMLALGLCGQPSRAQNANTGVNNGVGSGVNSGVSIGPSEALSSPAQETGAAPAETLFGDPGGFRAKLARVGIDLTLDYTTEVAGNATGGLKQGTYYAGQIGFEADIDWNKLAGVQGLSTHVVIVNRQGTQVGSAIGDNLNQVQEIYGAGGDVIAHLVYAYAEESLLNGRVDIAVGRMPVNNDFAASPIYCTFMSNTICGNPRPLVASDIGFSSYPDAVWGGRIRGRPTATTYIQTGVYEVNQNLYGRYHRSGFDLTTAGSSGVIIPVEVAYEPSIGPQALPGHYKLGFSYDTTTYSQFSTTVATVLGGSNRTANKTGFWALADQMVVRNGPGSLDGIVIFGGYAHLNPSVAAYTDEVFIGLSDKAFWPARPQDSIGLLFQYGATSSNLAKQQTLDIELGLPIANGATGVQRHEEVIEAHYDIHVYRGIDLQPTFQYYFRPNAVANIKDAAIFGFKAHVTF